MLMQLVYKVTMVFEQFQTWCATDDEAFLVLILVPHIVGMIILQVVIAYQREQNGW